MKLWRIFLLSSVISLLGCKSEPKTFTVTWMNEGKVLKVDEKVPLGTIPTYDGPTPTKINPIPIVKDYVFIGWDKELTPISSDIVYSALFKEEGEIADLAITFSVDEEHKEFAFTNLNTKVDWGDGSEVSEENYHEYTADGEYIIRFYTNSLFGFNIDSGLAGVTSLYFADTVNKINGNGFRNLENLKSVRLPNNLINLNAYTFTNNKVDFYKKIDNVYYLGNESNDHLYCFGTTNEEEIHIAEGCEILTDNSFNGSDLTTSLTLPTSLKVIGDNAFNSCEVLPSLSIPQNVEYIGECAFENCYQLVNINIPSKVEVINESTFDNCPHLETITIPNSVNEIKDTAFYACSALSLVDMSKVDHFVVGGSEMFEGCSATLTIEVKNNNLLNQYKEDPCWRDLNIVVA